MLRTIIPAQVSQHLDVEHKARQEGAKGHPPANATTLDGPQSEIEAHFTDALKEIRDGYIERLNLNRTERKELATKIHVTLAKDQFQQIGDDVEPNLMQLKVENEGALKRSVASKEGALRSLNAFRHEYKLVTTEPQYPESMWSHMSWVAVAALIEWILLSYFYKDIGGFIAGFFYASLFSIVNLLIAIILGNVLRQINLPSLGRKFLGVVGALICVISFLFATVLVSHFRYAAQEYAEERAKVQAQASQGLATGNVQIMQIALSELSWNSAKAIGNKAWEKVKRDWTDLPDPLGWIVIVATCIFGVVTAWKGYGMDDRFPGYGKRHSDFLKKDREYEKDKKIYSTHISDLFDSKQKAQEKIFRDTEANVQKFGRLCGTALTEVQKFETERIPVRDSCNAVLKIYRDVNTFVRAGAPVPAYFNQDIELDSSIERDLNDVADLKDCEKNEKQYSSALSEFSTLAVMNRKDMNEKKTKAFKDFQIFVSLLEDDIKKSLANPTKL